jgi:hypothetical protein
MLLFDSVDRAGNTGTPGVENVSVTISKPLFQLSEFLFLVHALKKEVKHFYPFFFPILC